MKKQILLGMAVLGMMASCSSDSDYQAVPERTINITSAKTELGPNASEGSVTVDCTPVEAYTDAPSWLTAKIEGNTVKLAAIANDSRQSRNANLVIKKTANDSINVNVSQYGLVLTMDQEKIVISDDAAATFTKECYSNADIQVLETPSWVKATIDESGKLMTVEVEPNTTGHLRACYVKYQAAAVRDSFLVKQFDFDTDIAGDYLFGYYDFNEDETGLELHAVQCTVDRDNITVPEWNFKFPITVDETDGAIDMKSNQLLGKYGKYFAYPLFVDVTGSAYFNNDTGKISCPFVWDKELGTSGFFNGKAYDFEGHTSDDFLGMLVEIFKANVPTPANLVGDWGWIIAPYMWKITDEDNATEAKAHKCAPKLNAATVSRLKGMAEAKQLR